MWKRVQCLTLVAALFCIVDAAGAQEAGPHPLRIERTEERTFTSKVNGVAYKLYVALPHGYASGAGRYPVVYLLDADYSFLIARNIADHLAEREHLRELIIVGIAYDGPLQYRRNRTRDYTPVFSPTGGYGPEMQKVSGGGPKFRSVLENELIPLIDDSYRTVHGDRCLVGHSYGGLFASWNLLATPSLFQRYIVVSPSLWYHDRMMFRLLTDHAKRVASLPVRAYFAVGASEVNSERDMVDDLRKFTRQLRERKYKGFALDSDVLDDETHNSVFPRALSNGLRFVYEGR
jgi:predicted alpha/beta superfamily hydrolase